MFNTVFIFEKMIIITITIPCSLWIYSKFPMIIPTDVGCYHLAEEDTKQQKRKKIQNLQATKQ